MFSLPIIFWRFNCDTYVYTETKRCIFFASRRSIIPYMSGRRTKELWNSDQTIRVVESEMLFPVDEYIALKSKYRLSTQRNGRWSWKEA